MEIIKLQTSEINNIILQLTGLVYKIKTSGVNEERMKLIDTLTEELSSKSNMILKETENLHEKYTEVLKEVISTKRELAKTKRRLNETMAEADEYHESNKKLREDLNSTKEMMKYFLDDYTEDMFEDDNTADKCQKASTDKTDQGDTIDKEKPIQTVAPKK